jgi:hypothetical protein
MEAPINGNKDHFMLRKFLNSAFPEGSRGFPIAKPLLSRSNWI